MTQTPKIITDLVQKFERNIHEYRNPKYNETLIRVEFVNPFWKALGWDVDNEKGYAMPYRDVIHEDELKVGRTTRAPDYAFRVGGRRIFFLETKKPAIDLKHDPAAAFQLRRYAYSAKLAVSLLTDFEELIVYDCRIKPAMTDKPHVGRMMYYTFQEYIEKWDELSGIFSKEAVMQGAFDRFIEDTQGKRPRAEIDRDFLNDLDKWRIELARNIALRNPGLTERELNYAVQLTIDRLIFLRMCEDRDIEQYETLMTLLNGNQIYRRLVKLYYKADHRYNSGLFHFEEKDGPNPDILTPKLEVDDKILKQIISELYYPKCPYEFSVLPVEVLGNAYEQFLGKRITLTEGHRARIEEKPEVRKAGGVYYTPQYIVDYIVKNTVGKLCEGKTPRDASELRILDPACGSGSFLLGAYQYLLDWHVNWYRTDYERTGQIPTSPTDKGKRKRKSDPQAILQDKGGECYLTTAEKKRILTNNIYGVDIDANAVEVTKLSLLLKVLEHETSETLNQQLGLWKERALPNLESNIKCGNSLIGTDFYEGKQAGFFNEEEALRINAFDWEREFPEIFAKGGFDAVIGNPPYIRIQISEAKDNSYFQLKYKSSVGNYDIYCLFIEKGSGLSNNKGRLGFILPHRFFKTDYGQGLRKYLVDKNLLDEIIDFDGYMVFNQASINTSILLLSHEKKDIFNYLKVEDRHQSENEISIILSQNVEKKEKSKFSVGIVEKNQISEAPWIFIRDYEKSLWKKLDCVNKKLSDVTTHIFQGLKTGADSIYILNLIKQNNHIYEFICPFDKKNYNLESDLLKPLIKGGNMNRYLISKTSRYVIFPYVSGKLLEEKVIKENYPMTYKYLTNHKKYLQEREHGLMKGENWYGYTRNQALTTMYLPKIITPDYYANASYCFDENGIYFFCGGGAGGYGIVTEKTVNPFYLLGLLNSKLLDWYLHKISLRAYQTAYMYVKKYISELPILIDKNPDIIKAVQKMLELHQKNSVAKDKYTRDILQRQINATDRQIDQLVYQFYGLTEEEIRIVEGNV